MNYKWPFCGYANFEQFKWANLIPSICCIDVYIFGYKCYHWNLFLHTGIWSRTLYITNNNGNLYLVFMFLLISTSEISKTPQEFTKGSCSDDLSHSVGCY